MRSLPPLSRRAPASTSRSSTATSAASRSICDRRTRRRCSTRCARTPTSSSTASGRRPRAGSASMRRRFARGIRAWSARRSAASARPARTPSAPRTTSTTRRSPGCCLAVRRAGLAGRASVRSIGDIGAAMQARRSASSRRCFSARGPGVGSIVDVSIHEAAMRVVRCLPIDDRRARRTPATTSTKPRTASGSRSARSSRSSGAGFCERIGRPDLAPLQHAHRRRAGARAERGARRHAQPDARRVARAVRGRRRVPDDDLHARRGARRSARRRAAAVVVARSTLESRRYITSPRARESIRGSVRCGADTPTRCLDAAGVDDEGAPPRLRAAGRTDRRCERRAGAEVSRHAIARRISAWLCVDRCVHALLAGRKSATRLRARAPPRATGSSFGQPSSASKLACSSRATAYVRR